MIVTLSPKVLPAAVCVYLFALFKVEVNGFALHSHIHFVGEKTSCRAFSIRDTILRSAAPEATEAVATEDRVIFIKPKAVARLLELKSKQPNPNDLIILRMGVKNGGCSGLSYAMDFTTEAAIGEDDVVDEYPDIGLKCIVDPKSMLYLYGLQLDYSEELIGGGFKFFNPNAEESCGCGSSFGI